MYQSLWLSASEAGEISSQEKNVRSHCPPRFCGFFLFVCLFFWLRWVFVTACRLSLLAESGGHSLVALHGLFISVASLV